MLATLSLRIIDDADVRTKCSLLDRVVMPGNGSTSRLHTSDKSASSLARSLRVGARTGILDVVVSRDCDRLMLDDVGPELAASFTTHVFLRIT